MHFKYRDPCIIADIPGLVEDAHKGVGLGHKFLRHIERTRVLLHVVDMSEEKRDDNYGTIVKELEHYRSELAARTQVVVLNKSDLVDEKEMEIIEKHFSQFNQNVISVSGVTGHGIDTLIDRIMEILDETDKDRSTTI